MPFIGIDLGTTYSCVAAMQREKVEVIANEQGHRTTPSCVAFTNDRRLVGEAAKHQMSKNPANTIYDAKRLIGLSFEEPVVQADKKRWPFEVINDDGKPKFNVDYKRERRTIAPEEISSMVLQQMKKCAEDFLGEGVQGAVITVPAYFNDAQRRATRDAATIANLGVLRLINEPTAAAIAYGLDKDMEVKRNVLIFDLGGGTFDVTVLKIRRGDFEVLATAGDTHLGGQDFNERMFNHFSTVIGRKTGVNVKDKPRAMSRLREACENAKKALSTSTRAEIQLDGLIDGEDFDTHITRIRFEQLNDDLFKGTLETVGRALEDSEMDKKQIDEVVLVGGSTRIPMIQKLLADYFGAEKICKTINPDEAVAVGAAYAASASGKPTPQTSKFNLMDVTPLSLGIETKGGVMAVVVKRNTKIPVEKSHNFTTVEDNQNVVNFRVFEGERSMTKANRLLGNFLLKGIPAAPAGDPILRTSFNIDKDGVLNVSAVETSGGKRSGVTITQKGRQKDEAEIKRMEEQAKKFRQEDERWSKRMQVINELEAMLHKARISIEQKEAQSQKNNSTRRRSLAQCEAALESVMENEDLSIEKLQSQVGQFKSMLGDVE